MARPYLTRRVVGIDIDIDISISISIRFRIGIGVGVGFSIFISAGHHNPSWSNHYYNVSQWVSCDGNGLYRVAPTSVPYLTGFWFVPTTISGITQPTTSSTSIGVPFISPGGAPPPVIPPPGIPPPGIPDGCGDGGNDPTSTNDSSSLSSSSSSTQATITPDETYVGNTACGTDSDAATRTTTFSKKSTAATQPPSQTVTKGCTVCVLPAGSLDPACQPISGCIDTQATPTTASAPPATTAANTTPTAVFPTVTGVNCGTDSTGGARLSDCLAILGSVASGDKICTSDEGRCQKSGNSLGGNPLVETSSFCQIGQNSGCAFVVANKLSSFGFPGSSCFTGSQIDNFIRMAANQCNSGNNAYAIAQGPSSFDSFCLLSQDGPGLCGA